MKAEGKGKYSQKYKSTKTKVETLKELGKYTVKEPAKKGKERCGRKYKIPKLNVTDLVIRVC